MKFSPFIYRLTKIFVILNLIVGSSILLTFIYYRESFYYSTNYLQNNSLHLNTDFSILNQSRWITPNFRNTSFVFETETYEWNNPIRNNVTYSVNTYNMGTTDWFKWNCSEWGEWGYSFHHLKGQVDGAGNVHDGGYNSIPKNKQEAFEIMKQYVINYTSNINRNTRSWVSFNGHYPYHHYAAEFGFDSIGTEIGENIDCYQVMMAFNRGAARQYNLPWFVDVSAWNAGTINDYSTPSLWVGGGTNMGHSLSLFNRTYTMAYMAGTSRVIAEGGCYNLFYYKNPSPTGLLDLTPLGVVGRKFSQLTRDHSNRGISYNPIGIMIDFYHGSNGIGGLGDSPKTFNSIEYNPGDWMTFKLLDMIYPGCWNDPINEKGALINNEFGDMFDILLQNAPIDVLSTYPVIILSGDINFQTQESARLVEYVKNGGTLLVNSAFFPALNAELKSQNQNITLTLSPFEKAKVIPLGSNDQGMFIAYGPDYNSDTLRCILRELMPMISPFELSSTGPAESNQGTIGAKVNIQSMINRNANGWILTLINNDGITKAPKFAPTIDQTQQKEITIFLNKAFLTQTQTNSKLTKITEWFSNNEIWSGLSNITDLDNISIRMTLNPGDMTILQFEFA